MFKKIFWLAVVIVAFSRPFVSLAYTSPGVPTGFVNDYAGLLNAQEKKNFRTLACSFYSQYDSSNCGRDRTDNR
jgi:hypothetical protein